MKGRPEGEKTCPDSTPTTSLCKLPDSGPAARIPLTGAYPDLCRQMRRAASSVAMCLDEGSQRTGRD